MKISGRTAPNDLILLAAAVDRLSFLVWAKTKDAEKGINRPESIAAKILGIDKEKNSEYALFSTPEEFEEARRRAIEGV